MNKVLIIGLSFLILTACDAPIPTFRIPSSTNYTAVRSSASAVRVRVTRGLKDVAPPGSFVKEREIQVEIIEGEFPNAKSKQARLLFPQSAADAQMTNGAILTLTFASDGSILGMEGAPEGVRK
jgi:hypothetical protein